MKTRPAFSWLAGILLAIVVLVLPAEPIPVLQRQGALHGFLLLLNEQGKQIAAGEEYNIVRGNEIQTHLIYRFGDGSFDQETAVYRQSRVFRLVWYHQVQKGPSFPSAVDLTIDVAANRVAWIDKDGKKSRHMQLPADLANGLIPLAVEDFPRGAGVLTVHYLALAPEPRIVKMIIKPDGSEEAKFGATSRKADRFNVHIDIGGVAGVVAGAIGKQPPDFKLWISDGPAPIFLRMTGAVYFNGPPWTMVLSAPRWTGKPE